MTKNLPPTPWQVGPYDPRYVFDAHGQTVVVVAWAFDKAVPVAKFLSAAPDMYEALEAVLSVAVADDGERRHLDWDTIERVRAVLARAETP